MILGFMFNGLFLGVGMTICLALVVTMILAMIWKDPEHIEQILKQILSARWLLAVMAGIAFVFFCAATVVAMITQRADFKPETIVSIFGMLLLIIQGVYKDYFQAARVKEANEKANGNGNSNGDEPQPPPVVPPPVNP